MSEKSRSAVDCPVCETAFDPTAAGGWCTNPECGEWRYERAADGGDPDTGDRSDASPADDPEGGASAVVEEMFQPSSHDPEPEPEPQADEESRSKLQVRKESDSEPRADEESDSEPRADEEPGEDSQESEQDAGGKPAETTVECPECATELDADARFCPECGVDVSALPEGQSDGAERNACPECGEEVDPEDSFCASCGTTLAEPESLVECPSCGVEVGPADSYCAGCGEHLDPHRSGDDAGTPASDPADATGSAPEPAQEAPAALSLTTRGRELTVSDGDTVGRRVRRIVSDTSDDEAAVRIHREHVRFIRENGQFHVVDLGDNPTRVNDHSLNKGDRQLIGPGDELGLSGVVTLNVDRP